MIVRDFTQQWHPIAKSASETAFIVME